MTAVSTEITISGIAYYAHVHKPNRYGAYSIDLVVDDETASKLRNLGLKQACSKTGATDEFGNELLTPKSYPDHPGKVFSFKRKVLNKDGEPIITKSGALMTPPPVVDSRAEPMTANVGNGSLVNIKVGLWPSTSADGKQFQGNGLNAVQVIDLIPFEAGEPGAFDPTGGFKPIKSAGAFSSKADF